MSVHEYTKTSVLSYSHPSVSSYWHQSKICPELEGHVPCYSIGGGRLMEKKDGIAKKYICAKILIKGNSNTT